jgi:glycerophosphoryl diester phosphodiesterase
MTADGQIVIIHDDTVDRTTDGSGPVSQMALAQIRELDAGKWKSAEFAGQQVPTFDEVLELAASSASTIPAMALDVKDLQPGIIRMICDSLSRHDLLRHAVGIGVVINSVDVRRRFYEGNQDFQCAALAQTRDLLQQAIQDPYSSWVYARFVPRPEDMDVTHAAGKKLFAVNPSVADDGARSVESIRTGADMVLSWAPAALEKLLPHRAG